jgi:hypothetical protein
MTLEPTLLERVRAQFKLSCRKCGSEDVTIDYEAPSRWSEHTSDPGTLSMGCNGCKANDLLEYL